LVNAIVITFAFSQSIFSNIPYLFTILSLLIQTPLSFSIIKLIQAKDDKAFRSLTVTWFEHSNLHSLLKKLAEKNVNVVFTTDHGTTQVQSPSKCVGDKQTSANIRYKAGKNLQFNEKDVFIVKNPKDAYLPQANLSTTYIFAKEDNFLIYQNNYNQFSNFFKNSFQHGGISLEEMIIPISFYKSK
jgi:hypothetical protein